MIFCHLLLAKVYSSNVTDLVTDLCQIFPSHIVTVDESNSSGCTISFKIRVLNSHCNKGTDNDCGGSRHVDGLEFSLFR
jgi:hypothetical protein